MGIGPNHPESEAQSGPDRSSKWDRVTKISWDCPNKPHAFQEHYFHNHISTNHLSLHNLVHIHSILVIVPLMS